MRAETPPPAERLRRWNATHTVYLAPALIAVNVAIYFLSRGGNIRTFEDKFMLYGPYVTHGRWYEIISSGFLHASLLHLAMNMLALYQLGLLLEPPLGRLRFGFLYFSALLAGSAGALIASPHTPSLGASGAIFGLLGAAAIGLHRRGVNIWHSGLGPLLVINLLITFTVPGISAGGHVGGLIGGAAVGGVMLRPGVRLGGREIDLAGLAAAVVVAVAAVVVAFNVAASA